MLLIQGYGAWWLQSQRKLSPASQYRINSENTFLFSYEVWQINHEVKAEKKRRRSKWRKFPAFLFVCFDLFLTSRGSGVSAKSHFLYFITMTDNFIYMDDFFFNMFHNCCVYFSCVFWKWKYLNEVGLWKAYFIQFILK